MPKDRSAWWWAAATVVPVLLLFEGVSVPGGYYCSLALAFALWGLVGAAWAAGVVRTVRSRHPRSPWPLLVVPAVFVTGWVVASGDTIGRATFALHRTALEELAANAGPEPPWGVGPYSFEHVYRHQGCTVLSTDDPAMANSAGLVWCPGGAPAGFGEDEALVLTPIDGDWYAYEVRYRPIRGSEHGPWGLDTRRFGPRVET